MKRFYANNNPNTALQLGILLLILSTSCANTRKTNNHRRFEVKIQEKTWSFEMLNVSSFKNGDSITEAKTKEDWIRAGREKTPAWAYYNNNPAGVKIYNWYAVNCLDGLAPDGWHIPSDMEWSAIITQFGGEMVAGKNMNDLTEGKIQPAGIRDSTGSFISHVGAWWTKTSLDENNALRRFGYPNKDFLLRSYNNKMEGLSVICIKD